VRSPGRLRPDESLFSELLALSPMNRGATCLKKRRRVGKQQHTMKRLASTMLH